MRRCDGRVHVRYALERKTFGVAHRPEHQMVQAMIAEMGIKYEATRLLVTEVGLADLDQGGRNSLVAS